jgi:hypothetical protein
MDDDDNTTLHILPLDRSDSFNFQDITANGDVYENRHYLWGIHSKASQQHNIICDQTWNFVWCGVARPLSVLSKLK